MDLHTQPSAKREEMRSNLSLSTSPSISRGFHQPASVPRNLQSDAVFNQLLKPEVEEWCRENSFERSWEGARMLVCQEGTVKKTTLILVFIW